MNKFARRLLVLLAMSVAMSTAAQIPTQASPLSEKRFFDKRPLLKTKSCKRQTVRGTAFRDHKSAALRYARLHWRKNVTAVYGPGYSRWSAAAMKGQFCKRDRIEQGYKCVVAARPCFPSGIVKG